MIPQCGTAYNQKLLGAGKARSAIQRLALDSKERPEQTVVATGTHRTQLESFTPQGKVPGRLSCFPKWELRIARLKWLNIKAFS